MSAASAKTSLGTKLFAVATGGALAQIGELLSFSPPQITRETLEASDLATTGGAEFISGGLYDVGPVSGSMHYVAGSTADDLFVAAVTGGGLYDFKIVVKAASGTEDMTFSGYVTSYGPDEMTVGGKQTASFSIKPTGDIAQAASA